MPLMNIFSQNHLVRKYPSSFFFINLHCSNLHHRRRDLKSKVSLLGRRARKSVEGMLNVYVCFGACKAEFGWEFKVDSSRGARMIAVENVVGVKEFVNMICEEYDLEGEEDLVDISYALPEHMLVKMPRDTPHVFIKKDSQLKIFLNMAKTEILRLCVSKREEAKHSSEKEDHGGDDDPIHDNSIDDKPIDDNSIDDDPFDDGNDDDNTKADENDGEHDDDDDDDDENEDDDTNVEDDDTNVDGSQIVSGTDSTTTSANHTNDENNDGGDEKDGRRCNSLVVVNEKGCSSSSGCFIEVGDIFDSKKQLINQLRRLTIVKNFDYDVSKSSKKLYVAKCFVVGCSWMVRATSLSPASVEFLVRKMVDEHTCSATVRYSRHRQATAKCIGRLYVEKFVGSGQLKGIKPRHIMDTMKAVYGIEFEYTKAHAALTFARSIIRGSPEDGYSELPTYLHMLKKANPGTITRLECDIENRFKYLFFAFSASVAGFEFLRKVVVVDGTHLKGKFKGALLVAAAQDGNSNIFPLAFGIVDSENDASWEWFFVQLQSVVANARGLVFISDRHKSIAKGIRKVFPAAHRGICTYHLGQNIRSRFRGTTTLNLFKKAAKVARLSEFNALFEVIRGQDLKLAQYLEKADIMLWSRAHFPGCRYNIMTSNICESINAVLKEAREFPIAAFIDHVRRMIVRWFNERREAHGRLDSGEFSPEVEKVLLDRTELSNRLTVQSIDYTRSLVMGGRFDCIVDITQGTCTCRMFEIEKIPCEHAIATARHRNVALATLVHECYTKGFLYAAYSEALNPLNPDLPVPLEVAVQRCLPPEVKVPPGRPKMKRYASALERGKRVQGSGKKQKPVVCSQCNHLGHNRSTCTN